jgi:hypothetical protein
VRAAAFASLVLGKQLRAVRLPPYQPRLHPHLYTGTGLISSIEVSS